MIRELENKIWWNYIHEDLKELFKQSYLLIDFVDQGEKPEFHDYAFIVFPAAKAYEGFLKTLFHDLGFIDDEEFNGKRFRIGKALNPSLEQNLRAKEGVYDKLVSFCQGPELADTLWQTWKKARNLLFHWFPHETNAISFDEAKDRLKAILGAMDSAFKECKIDR
jgi:hypothetical protein